MEARVRERETEGRVEFAEKKKMRMGLTLFLEKEECWIFYLLTFSENWKWSLFETLTQFSTSTLEMHEFSHFNQILLSLFDVSMLTILHLNCLYYFTYFRFNVN